MDQAFGLPAWPASFEVAPFGSTPLEVDALRAARSLLGALLVSSIGGVKTVGRIVEVEAYFGPSDPASHAAARIGRTPRNRPMFGPAGTTYVYRIYGVHRCVNVVTGRRGVPAAVLIRALEPLSGVQEMTSRRGRSDNLCSGPGRLAAALGIDETLNGHDLTNPPLQLLGGLPVPDGDVGVSGRIGVSRAMHWPLRYFVKGHPRVSRTRAPEPRRTPDFLEALSAENVSVFPEPR